MTETRRCKSLKDLSLIRRRSRDEPKERLRRRLQSRATKTSNCTKSLRLIYVAILVRKICLTKAVARCAQNQNARKTIPIFLPSLQKKLHVVYGKFVQKEVSEMKVSDSSSLKIVFESFAGASMLYTRALLEGNVSDIFHPD